jgi:predicted nucleic acid-binding protein
MTVAAVYLDSQPLGLASQRLGKSQEADDCQSWVNNLLAAGVRVVIPEIADYEVRRELILNKNTNGVKRLTALRDKVEYLPITTAAMERAAELWAEGRRIGRATADPHALDGDVILSAQLLTAEAEPTLTYVATSNMRHLVRYVPYAELWRNTVP